MLILVTYQIKSDKIRTRVNKTLKNFGSPIQNSIFEFKLDNSQLKLLFGKLAPFKEQLEGNDSIRVYTICEKCAKNIKIFGNAKKTEEPLYYLV
jgi:CRISPR-associated endonuclease Cas2